MRTRKFVVASRILVNSLLQPRVTSQPRHLSTSSASPWYLCQSLSSSLFSVFSLSDWRKSRVSGNTECQLRIPLPVSFLRLVTCPEQETSILLPVHTCFITITWLILPQPRCCGAPHRIQNLLLLTMISFLRVTNLQLRRLMRIINIQEVRLVMMPKISNSDEMFSCEKKFQNQSIFLKHIPVVYCYH